LIKCSGVLPVGKLITPFGFSLTHSKKRKEVRNPKVGKLGTTTKGGFVEQAFCFEASKKCCSTPVNKYDSIMTQ